MGTDAIERLPLTVLVTLPKERVAVVETSPEETVAVVVTLTKDVEVVERGVIE